MLQGRGVLFQILAECKGGKYLKCKKDMVPEVKTYCGCASSRRTSSKCKEKRKNRHTCHLRSSWLGRRQGREQVQKIAVMLTIRGSHRLVVQPNRSYQWQVDNYGRPVQFYISGRSAISIIFNLGKGQTPPHLGMPAIWPILEFRRGSICIMATNKCELCQIQKFKLEQMLI